MGMAPGLGQAAQSATSRAANTADLPQLTGDDPAPASLQELLTRLELADRLAAGGYALTLVELAQLVEQPLTRLAERQQAWSWRDWLVEPVEGDCWRLRRDEAGSR